MPKFDAHALRVSKPSAGTITRFDSGRSVVGGLSKEPSGCSSMRSYRKGRYNIKMVWDYAAGKRYTEITCVETQQVIQIDGIVDYPEGEIVELFANHTPEGNEDA